MKVRVLFRYNHTTGTVEELLVDASRELEHSLEQHNHRHEQLASEIGRLLDPNPIVSEQAPDRRRTAEDPSRDRQEQPRTESDPEDERLRGSS